MLLKWDEDQLLWDGLPLLWGLLLDTFEDRYYDILTPIFDNTPKKFREPIRFDLYVGVTFNNEDFFPFYNTYYLHQQVLQVVQLLTTVGYRVRVDTVFANGIIETRIQEAGPNRLAEEVAIPGPEATPAPTDPPPPSPEPPPAPGPGPVPPPAPVFSNSLDFSDDRNSMYLPLL